MRIILRSLAIAALLGGCASFPELNATVSDSAKNAEFPTLIPAESLLSRQNTGRLKETDGASLLARADRLRARGRILRGLPTIDEATRLRIAANLRRLGG